MGDDFGVSFGGELVSFFDELFLRAEIVLNDAVVDNDDLSGAVAMRMGVFFGRTSVRGPARMADAVAAVGRFEANDFFQIAQLAFRTAHLPLVSITSNGDSGRIITAAPLP